MKVERDQELQSTDSLFTRMAEVVFSASPSALPVPAAPPRNNSPLRHKRSPPNSKSRKPKTKRVRRTRSSPGRSASPDPFGELDLCRQSDRRATIKLILLLLIPMVLCWRHYRRPVLPPDVELHRLPRNHRLIRIVQRSALIPPVRNTNLTVVPRECPWWIFLESLQATLNVTSASRVILGVPVIHC